jgi:hypothetical protein
MLRVMQSVRFTATATRLDGSNTAVTQWSTDTASVMSVDAASGLATGVAAGGATLSASYEGVVQTRLIRVVPDYGGVWSGSFRVTSCSDSGNYAEAKWCEAAMSRVIPLMLSLTQTRDAVAGTITIDDHTGTTVGPIAENGQITLSGAAVSGSSTMTIVSWSTNSGSPGWMAGTFSISTSSSSLSGNALMNCELTTMTKEATAPAVGLRAPR